jgi:hypothetical protein
MVQQIVEILFVLAFALYCPVVQAVLAVVESAESLFIFFLGGFFIQL